MSPPTKEFEDTLTANISKVVFQSLGLGLRLGYD